MHLSREIPSCHTSRIQRKYSKLSSKTNDSNFHTDTMNRHPQVAVETTTPSNTMKRYNNGRSAFLVRKEYAGRNDNGKRLLNLNNARQCQKAVRALNNTHSIRMYKLHEKLTTARCVERSLRHILRIIRISSRS